MWKNKKICYVTGIIVLLIGLFFTVIGLWATDPYSSSFYHSYAPTTWQFFGLTLMGIGSTVLVVNFLRIE